MLVVVVVEMPEIVVGRLVVVDMFAVVIEMIEAVVEMAEIAVDIGNPLKDFDTFEAAFEVFISGPIRIFRN